MVRNGTDGGRSYSAAPTRGSDARASWPWVPLVAALVLASLAFGGRYLVLMTRPAADDTVDALGGTVYLGIEVDDALEIAEQTEI